MIKLLERTWILFNKPTKIKKSEFRLDFRKQNKNVFKMVFSI